MELQTIGEVSRLFHVSTRTLRYYEQIGLIQPAKREDSAYRMYDGDTLLRLKQIIILRKLRIPLKHIARILAMDNAAYAIEVFERSLNEIGEEINALQTIKSVIQAFLDRMQMESATLPLFDDESLLEIVDSLTLTQSSLKGEKSMDELQQASDKLDRLTDRDVRILYLPPATVAAYQYEGDEPENHVGQVVDRFVRESGLARIKPDLRHYGFNAPNPTDETNAHGYEMWVTVPEDMEIPPPLTRKHFPGGLYAAYMIPMGAFEGWGLLWDWVTHNEKYDMDNQGKGGECMYGLLEEHLNYINHLQLPYSEPEDMQLDLLIPIKARG